MVLVKLFVSCVLVRTLACVAVPSDSQGLGSVKIMIWDHNRDGMFERAAAAYSDPEAEKYIWGCAYSGRRRTMTVVVTRMVI